MSARVTAAVSVNAAVSATASVSVSVSASRCQPRHLPVIPLHVHQGAFSAGEALFNFISGRQQLQLLLLLLLPCLLLLLLLQLLLLLLLRLFLVELLKYFMAHIICLSPPQSEIILKVFEYVRVYVGVCRCVCVCGCTYRLLQFGAA